ncbi:hypothetical protein CHITON_1743 [Thermococcus chitonophagus]|uniref:Uncharacterized protein n=1 Tax=Thermococcus chitonophagus TaxID=54262 RepID=A0A160VU22_9EURY|nr:hypothetical protein CHITON_1743 [Thermococcus chitonophagus]
MGTKLRYLRSSEYLLSIPGDNISIIPTQKKETKTDRLTRLVIPSTKQPMLRERNAREK